MQRKQEITRCDLTAFNKEVLDSEGRLRILPHAFYKTQEVNTVLFFMHQFGIYVLPTLELIEFLRANIVGSAIEIGCGNGAIGRALGIPVTDSKLQQEPLIAAYYKSINAPIISYPADVEKLDAEAAIQKYKPKTVVGAFITHKYNGKNGNMYGVIEEKIIQSAKYIHVGNNVTHGDKPILKHPHQSLYFDWLITRSVNQEENRIMIFTPPLSIKSIF